MINRLWYLSLLLFWLIPALACGGGSPVVPTATTAAGPKATAGTAGKFGPIQFSVGVLNDETPVDPLNTYPDGVTLVYAVFDYSGLKGGETWRTEWKLDGQVQPDLGQEQPWKAGGSGKWWVSASNLKSIKTGEWELDLYLGGTLQQTAKFTVVPNPATQPDFGPITFATEKDSKDKPVNALSVDNPILPKGTKLVYAFFDGINVPKGTAWTSQWFRNGDSLTSPKDHTWDFGPNENDWINFGSTTNSVLDSGTYELKLSIGSRVVNLAAYIMP